MLDNYKVYLSTNDIVEIYEKVNGSRNNLAAFKKDAKEVATKTKKGSLIYKDELALYDVFEKHLGDRLASLGIDCFGRLMQYI